MLLMYSKDNQENQQKLMFIDIPHQIKCICKTMRYQPMKGGQTKEKSISVNRNKGKNVDLYYHTLKA